MHTLANALSDSVGSRLSPVDRGLADALSKIEAIGGCFDCLVPRVADCLHPSFGVKGPAIALDSERPMKVGDGSDHVVAGFHDRS